MKERCENTNEGLKGKTIYQLSLRTITPQGTLNAAAKMLPHIASLGFDIVYLTACFSADNDFDVNSWSERQIKSGCGNPKNPYKIVDYFNVDDEYGTNDDLHKFVEKAHEIGLGVMFDLVYLHCSKNAVFIKDNPDFVKRNEDGTILMGDEWPFARLNFDNLQLREYLYSNMEYFVREYDVDGFRCDVADSIPLDFWEEGIRRVKAIKPSICMLSEGKSSKFIEHAFDGSYQWPKNQIHLINMYKDSSEMYTYKKFFEEEPYCSRALNYLDSHDTASDVGSGRYEKVFGNDGVESIIFLIYTIGGIPFMWNGMEVCDDSENCMFSNRFFGRKNFINWSYALTDKGKKRMEFVKKLSELYHTKKALYDGTTDFTDVESDGDTLLCFIRKKNDEKLFVGINIGNSPVSFIIQIKYTYCLMAYKIAVFSITHISICN
jgi:cyclomaltodextrinase